MATPIFDNIFEAEDVRGRPVPFGKVYTYEPGTTTPKITYSDEAGTVPNSNPVILDSSGKALIYGDGEYTIDVKTASEQQVNGWPRNIWSKITVQDTIKPINSIADLRNYNGVFEGQVVRVKYYSTIGDGGGGPDRYWSEGQPPGTYVDNGGSIIVPTGGDGSAAWLMKSIINADSAWFGGSVFIYVDPTGSDSNDGFDVSRPVATLQKAADILISFGPNLTGSWKIKASAGTWTKGVIIDKGDIISPNVEIEGTLSIGSPVSILDGTSDSNLNGFNFNAIPSATLKNFDIINYSGSSSSGVVFQNGTRGVIDTCNASNNGFADFNASEDSELVVIGECTIGSGSRYGMRVYRNSSGSIGDGTNTVTIDGATEAGILSRDGSKVVCDDNIIVNNCVSGIRMFKDGYVELRTSTISNNTNSGIFGDTTSQFDTQSGTINFSGNTVDKKFLGFTVDRSELNLLGTVPYYLRPYNSTVTAVTPTSNYDILLDGNVASGIQALLDGNSFSIDANKTERLTLNTSDNTLRLVLAGAENYRFQTTTFRTADDNIKSLGAASFRWSVVYAGTGTINTSDERQKQDIQSLSDIEKSVAIDLKKSIKTFRFKDAVEKKGDEARIHTGVIAQEVVAIFQNHGLDPYRYGILCYDEFEGGSIYGIRYEELLSFIISAL